MGLPDDRMDMQCLLQAMENYVNAKRKHDRARDNYTGYSWGYHGSDYINAMNEAAVDYGEYLDRYIEARINAVLAAREAHETISGRV